MAEKIDDNLDWQEEKIGRAEFIKFKRQVVKYLDKKFSEMYDEIHKIDDAESAIADEAIEKAERAQRHARRIEKELKEHLYEGHADE